MKDNFNNQFATQKLREDDYAKHGVKPFNPATEQMGKMVATVDIPRLGISAGREYPMSKSQFDQVMRKLQLLGDTEEMESVTFVNTSLEEEGSVTSAGEGSSTFKGEVGEQPAPRATKKVVRKNLNAEVADVETKLAAGKAKIYPKEKWGWKEAPSVPNRSSEMFDYKELWPEEKLNENYSRFRNETKTRTKEQQFHTAVRLAEKKILDANRILEYTAQLKGELNEVRVGKHTQKLMERITKGIAEAYGKMKKLK